MGGAIAGGASAETFAAPIGATPPTRPADLWVERAAPPRSRQLSEAGTVMAFRALSIALGLAYVKVYTRYLGAGELGTFFYLSTLSYAINALVFVPVDYYVQAKLADAGPVLPLDALWRLNKKVLLLALGTCTAMCVPLLLLRKIHGSDVLGIYATAVLLYSCTSLRTLLNNRNHKRFVVCILVFEGAARIGIMLLALHLFAPGARLLLYTAALALALELVIIVAFTRRALQFGHGVPFFGNFASILTASYPISLSAVCNVLQLQAYRFLYVWFGVSDTAAIYTVVANLGAAGMSATSAVYSQMFLPRIYATGGTFTGRYIRIGLCLGVAVSVGAAAFGPQALHLLTRDAYAGYAMAVNFGVLVEAGNLVIGAATVFLMMRGASSKLVACNVGAALGSMVGELVAVHWWPSSPYAIGIPIALSQLCIGTYLVALVARSNSVEARTCASATS